MGVPDCLLGVPDCYWAFSAMDWAFPIPIGRRKLFEETIRRSGAHDNFGVAHTMCFGVAHTIKTGNNENTIKSETNFT